MNLQLETRSVSPLTPPRRAVRPHHQPLRDDDEISDPINHLIKCIKSHPSHHLSPVLLDHHNNFRSSLMIPRRAYRPPIANNVPGIHLHPVGSL